jgi:predicted RNA-binding Zn ribbon-like protein
MHPTDDPTHPDSTGETGHDHVADLDTCLELINTVELTDGVPEDHIPTADDVIAWFVDRALVHDDALRRDAGTGDARNAWLHRVRASRAALRELWDAAVEGRSADRDAVETLNDALAHAPRRALRPGLASVRVDHRHDADATAEAIARLAEPLVDAIVAGDTSRFRICANDGCRWVFEDTSRGGRRRWCDMRSCGNRAKVRRYRSRHRDDEPATGDLAETHTDGA